MISLLLLGFLLLTPRAHAATVVSQSPLDLNPLQAWTDTAHAPVPTVPIEVEYADCQGSILTRGCSVYDPVHAVGRIKMDASLRTDAAERVYFHELGHVFAFQRFYKPDRELATEILGFPEGTAWTSQQGQIQPSEWFAEAATRCYMGRNPIIPAYGFNFDFSSPEIQGICDLMNRAALQPPHQAMTFRVVVPPQRKMISIGVFEPGMIDAKVTLNGRTTRARSQCYSTVRSGRNRITVGTCGNRIRLWSRSRKKAVLVITAVPGEQLPTTRFNYSALTKTTH